jgi:uncharacterized protein
MIIHRRLPRYNPHMPNVDQHAPGSFCWIELATTDQNAAKEFYTRLFGWAILDQAMGPSGVYTLFQIEGRSAAAAYGMPPAMTSMGIPPHWDIYVSVDSADETVKRTGELGGKTINGPFDVMDYGRMAVCQDTTGAVFCVWQPKSGIGIYVRGVPGTLCWVDLSTPEPERAKQFYEGLFGWKISASGQDSWGYLHLKNGDDFIGGIQPGQHRNASEPPHWLAYFYVENVDASVKKGEELGARTYVPPMEIPGAGRMAVLADPQGAVFAIFQPVPHGS